MLPSAVAVLLIAACGGGDRSPAADSTALALVPQDSAATVVSPEELRPAPAPAPPPAQAQPPARRPVTQPVPPAAQPEPPPAPAPEPPPAAAPLRAAAGTEIVAVSTVQISSRTNKAGDSFTAKVTEAVVDGAGRTVVPAGSTILLRITAIKEAENTEDTGTLVILPVSVTVGDEAYDVKADVSDLQYELRGRGVTAGDAGKVAAGAAIGAVVGRVLSKKGSGAVVGGAVGAAAGTAIAIKSADKDIVVPVGARVVIKLTEPLIRT